MCVETVLTCAEPVVGVDAQNAQDNASLAVESCVDSVAACMGGLADWLLAPDDWLIDSPDTEGTAEACATALQECIPTEQQVNERNVTRLVGCVMPFTPCAESPLAADAANRTEDNVVCPREPTSPQPSPAGAGPPGVPDPAILIEPGGAACYLSEWGAFVSSSVNGTEAWVEGSEPRLSEGSTFSPRNPVPAASSCRSILST